MAPPVTTSPEDVSRHEFSHAFRGYDITEVRDYLRRLSDELRRLRNELDRVRRHADQPEPVTVLDRATVSAMLGEEAARVLDAAHQAGEEIKAKAEQRVARMLREARDEAAELRRQAEQDRAELLDATEAELATARADAEAVREGVEQEREAELDTAREEGERIKSEAYLVRTRLLEHLAGERRDLRRQLEQLKTGRDRMLDSLGEVAQLVDDTRLVLEAAPGQAQAAAVGAAERFDRTELTASTDEVVAEALALPEPPAAPEAGDATDATGATDATNEAAGTVETVVDIGAEAAADAELPSGDVTQFAIDTGDECESVTVVPRATPGTSAADGSETGDATATESTAEDPAADDVGSIFARMRSSLGDAPVAETASTEEPADDSAEALVLAGDLPEAVVTLAEQREQVVARWAPLLSRTMKRELNDELNELLVSLRGQKGTPDHSAIFATTADRLAAAVLEPLSAAAAAAGEEGQGAGVEELAATVAGDAVAGLRARLGDGATDADDLAEQARALVREWRRTRADVIGDDAVRAAFGLGVLAAQPEGTTVRWISLDGEFASADCQDNSLAGPVACGEPFPSGAKVAPACSGCRCLVAPDPG